MRKRRTLVGIVVVFFAVVIGLSWPMTRSVSSASGPLTVAIYDTLAAQEKIRRTRGFVEIWPGIGVYLIAESKNADSLLAQLRSEGFVCEERTETMCRSLTGWQQIFGRMRIEVVVVREPAISVRARLLRRR